VQQKTVKIDDECANIIINLLSPSTNSCYRQHAPLLPSSVSSHYCDNNKAYVYG